MNQEQFNDLLELFTTQINYDLTAQYSLLSYAQEEIQADLLMRIPLFANTDIENYSPVGQAFECPHTRANIDYDQNKGIDASFAVRIFVAAAEEAGFAESNADIQTFLGQHPDILEQGRRELEDFRNDREQFYISCLEENNLNKHNSTAKHLERILDKLNEACALDLMPPSFDFEDLIALLDEDTPPSFDDSSSDEEVLTSSSFLRFSAVERLQMFINDEEFARQLQAEITHEDSEKARQEALDLQYAQILQDRLEGVRFI
ncbi:hypothetical protein CC99x_006335 [Candidatus Berkiella cookevillensis]|uniref:Uncharacterized protein n=1 Tax=Candidatus Berkiella cookevillensis TaxID=437022 RepID=A0A0Q9YTB7_9GAMM|nr:hypothetical protein [Candidatus Berkiella cookevillensis]MCS5708524.1 hypothetical protein [Candidatus Berkiella cookevillensis]